VQGPQVFNWLPFTALAEGADADEVAALVERGVGRLERT
jgi:hypothetical protein